MSIGDCLRVKMSQHTKTRMSWRVAVILFVLWGTACSHQAAQSGDDAPKNSPTLTRHVSFVQWTDPHVFDAGKYLPWAEGISTGHACPESLAVAPMSLWRARGNAHHRQCKSVTSWRIRSTVSILRWHRPRSAASDIRGVVPTHEAVKNVREKIHGS
jgi:hypothetical protein